MAKRRDPEELRGGVPAAMMAEPVEPVPPVSVVLDYFALDTGTRLELLTRTNPNLARAAQIGYIFTNHIKPTAERNGQSLYVSGRVEQLERLAVSIDSGGRLDMIAALDAGGSLPGEYYDKSEDKKQFAPADD